MPKKVIGNKLYVNPNADKSKNEKWSDQFHNAGDLLNFPCPSRIMILGSPDSGKTNLTKNLLIHANPVWDNIFILHQECFNPAMKAEDESKLENIVDKSKKYIDEYKGCKSLYLKTVPPPKFWDQFAGQKNCLVVDDIDLKSYCNTAVRRDKVNKLWSYISTHRKLTIIAAFQDASNQAPTCIRRYSNVFILFPIRDKDVVWRIARGTGTDTYLLERMMDLLKNSHETITIDTTNDSPAKYRYNLSTVIDPDFDSDSESD